MCSNCEELIEKGLCPATCKGALLNLKKGMEFVERNKKCS